MKKARLIAPLLFALGVLLTSSGAAGSATFAPPAQNDSHFFPETKHTVKGTFLKYWREHGGLPQQGYPISEEMQEKSDTDGKTYTVQYFERAVFELHPENASPNDVLLSLLGVFLYGQKYPQGAPNQTPNNSEGSVLFKETGHRVGGKFLKYWQEHGALAQQGYPISDEFTEISDLDGKPYKVQYFERAVFEEHPENQPPHDVLLSQLGTFRYRARTQPAPTATRIPATPDRAVGTPTKAPGGESLGSEDFALSYYNSSNQESTAIVDNTENTAIPLLNINQDPTFLADYKELLKRVGNLDILQFRFKFETNYGGPASGWKAFSHDVRNGDGSRDQGMTGAYKLEYEAISNKPGRYSLTFRLQYQDEPNIQRIQSDVGLNAYYSSHIFRLGLRAIASPTNSTDVIDIRQFEEKIGADETGLRAYHRAGANVAGYPQNIRQNPWPTFATWSRR